MKISRCRFDQWRHAALFDSRSSAHGVNLDRTSAPVRRAGRSWNRLATRRNQVGSDTVYQYWIRNTIPPFLLCSRNSGKDDSVQRALQLSCCRATRLSEPSFGSSTKIIRDRRSRNLWWLHHDRRVCAGRVRHAKEPRLGGVGVSSRAARDRGDAPAVPRSASDAPSRISSMIALAHGAPPCDDTTCRICPEFKWGNAWSRSLIRRRQWLTSPRGARGSRTVPYGYVKFRAEFNFKGEPDVRLDLADDAKKVFINGKLWGSRKFKEASGFPLANYASREQPSEISYELLGLQTKERIWRMKGIARSHRRRSRSARSIESWQSSVFHHRSGREIDPEFGVWGQRLSSPAQPSPTVPAFTCAARVRTPATAEVGRYLETHLRRRLRCPDLSEWKFVGRYVTAAPEDSISRAVSSPAGSRNLLSFILAIRTSPPSSHAACGAYAEFSVRRTRSSSSGEAGLDGMLKSAPGIIRGRTGRRRGAW